MSDTLFKTVLRYSRKIRDNRSNYAVLAKIQEEVGELTTEVAVKAGDSYKPKGKDGIKGEAIDAILALMNLIYVDDPHITEAELIQKSIPKLEKWETKVKEFRNK